MNDDQVKTCSLCYEIKSISEFYIHKTGKESGRPYSRCKFCNNHNQNPYDSNKIKFRNARIRYGLSQDEYEALPNECGICGSTENLGIDHNHITGIVRDILCKRCNIGIGMFDDNPNLLIRATDYILAHYDQGLL